MKDRDIYNIDPVWGVPKEQISCPGCGKKYGHHKTKVCKKCEECSKCCFCKEPEFVDAAIYIPTIL